MDVKVVSMMDRGFWFAVAWLAAMMAMNGF